METVDVATIHYHRDVFQALKAELSLDPPSVQIYYSGVVTDFLARVRPAPKTVIFSLISNYQYLAIENSFGLLQFIQIFWMWVG